MQKEIHRSPPMNRPLPSASSKRTESPLRWLAASIIGAFSLIFSGCGNGRVDQGDKTFDVPHGGSLTMSGRFVADAAPSSPLPPEDLLLLYGSRSWTLSGFQDIDEAVAFATKAQYPDWLEFQRHAAHFLRDADWRGPAREELDWEPAEKMGMQLRRAQLSEIPGHFVIMAEMEGVPLWSVAFAKTRYEPRALEALARGLTSYSSPGPPDSSVSNPDEGPLPSPGPEE